MPNVETDDDPLRAVDTKRSLAPLKGEEDKDAAEVF